MIGKQTIGEIGTFDEKLFMMSGEYELCMRIIRKGWQIWCAPQSLIYHKVGGSRQEHINLFRNVEVLRIKDIPCNNTGYGCGRNCCEIRICMRLITPQIVYYKVVNFLKGQ